VVISEKRVARHAFHEKSMEEVSSFLSFQIFHDAALKLVHMVHTKRIDGFGSEVW
jgi:hypothetical protein